MPMPASRYQLWRNTGARPAQYPLVRTRAWPTAHENTIITGPTDTGKTCIGCAIGRQAAWLDHSVLYQRIPRLFEELALARPDGRFARFVDRLARIKMLVLDDRGTPGLTDQQRLDLLDIFDERYRRKSTLFTAQIPASAWNNMIGEPTIAEATLDRIIHNAHRITPKETACGGKNRTRAWPRANSASSSRNDINPGKRRTTSRCPGTSETNVPFLRNANLTAEASQAGTTA